MRFEYHELGPDEDIPDRRPAGRPPADPPPPRRVVLVYQIGQRQHLVPLVGPELSLPDASRHRVLVDGDLVELERGPDGGRVPIRPDESFVVDGREYVLRVLDGPGTPAFALGGEEAPVEGATERAPVINVDDGSVTGKQVRIYGPTFRVGRGRNCDLKLAADGQVSRRHFSIEVSDDGTCTLRDGGSSNGTFVNDRQVQDHVLEDGDVIKLGSNVLAFGYAEFPVGVGDGRADGDELDLDDEEQQVTGVFRFLGHGSPISVQEGREKIRVANAALGPIIHALDERQGAGHGRARLQAVLGATPARFASVFQGLEVRRSGIPEMDVLFNVTQSPPDQQRLLLSGALADLVERTLSMACDELAEKDLERLLRAVAEVNYRDRLRV